MRQPSQLVCAVFGQQLKKRPANRVPVANAERLQRSSVGATNIEHLPQFDYSVHRALEQARESLLTFTNARFGANPAQLSRCSNRKNPEDGFQLRIARERLRVKDCKVAKDASLFVEEWHSHVTDCIQRGQFRVAWKELNDILGISD